jgi:predicted HicB family RNase H-like nuclease
MATSVKKLTTQQHLERLRKYAEKELDARGTVQFRIDPKSRHRLRRAADQKKIPLGTLVRMWIIERLDEEGY